MVNVLLMRITSLRSEYLHEQCIGQLTLILYEENRFMVFLNILVILYIVMNLFVELFWISNSYNNICFSLMIYLLHVLNNVL